MTLLEQMNNRLASYEDQEKKQNALEAARHSMRLLVRAANQDRGLIEDKDWQEAMSHLNAVIGKEAP